MMVEYGERVSMKYDELDTETGTVECEWRQYKDAFDRYFTFILAVSHFHLPFVSPPPETVMLLKSCCHV